MNNKLDRCISYIYNEMDPSERVEFERELKRNENFLIETELLRNTSEKLKDLEPFAPPAHVVEEIHQKAANFKSPKITSVSWLKWSSAAAVILISVSISSYLIFSPATDHNIAPQNSVDSIVSGNVLIGAPSQQWSIDRVEVENFSEVQPSQQTEEVAARPQNNIPAEEGGGTPWVNNNDIIHFNTVQAATASQLDSIRTQSLKKLTPVERSQERARVQHRLHLTGSNK